MVQFFGNHQDGNQHFSAPPSNRSSVSSMDSPRRSLRPDANESIQQLTTSRYAPVPLEDRYMDHSADAQTHPSSRESELGSHDPDEQPSSGNPIKFEKAWKPAQHTWYTAVLQTFNRLWITETISCFGSLGALAAIIAILVVYDREPLPNWPYGMTINAVLSWFVLLLNSLMLGAVAACLGQAKWIHFARGERRLADMALYDQASRGAYGCVSLLWRSFLRPYAFLGGLITVFAIGVGPLVQQTVTVENDRINTTGLALIPRAQNYIEVSDVERATPVYAMKGAMYNALFSVADPSASDMSVEPTCSTGKCDFPPYQSLAICSSCTDVTTQLNSSCRTCGDNTEVCHHELPNNVSLDIFYQENGMRMNGGLMAVTSNQSGELGGDTFGASSLLNLTAIRVAEKALPTDVSAHQCSLYWCINTYNTTVDDGIFNEKIIESWHASADQRFTSTPASGVSGNLTRLDLRPPGRPSLNLTTTNFTVSGDSHQALSLWLRDNFNFNNSAEVNCNDDGSGLTTFLSQRPRDNDVFGPTISSPVPAVMRNLAAGMTRRVRQVSPTDQSTLGDLAAVAVWGYGEGFGPVQNGSVVRGVAWAGESRIHVRWPWIALPAALIVLAFAYVGLTVVETRRSGLEGWKLSQVPMLCAGLEDEEQSALRAAKDSVRMEEKAGEIVVTLRKGKEGWRFGTVREASESRL